MGLEIHYDDKAGTLEFLKDDFSICTTTLEKFNAMYSGNFSTLGAALLPPAVRWITRYGDKTYIFYEERPQYRQVSFTPEKLEGLSLDGIGKYNYYLPMPWLLYVIELSMGNEITNVQGYVMKRNDECYLDSTLHQIPVHNWYSNTNLCRPFYNQETLYKHTDLLSVIEQVHREIWLSGFNNDLRDTIDPFINLPGTFISKSSRAVLKRMALHSADALYNYYYTTWANAPMERMLLSNYNRVGSIRDLYGQFVNNEVNTFDANQFTSELLIAAQNSFILG